MKLFSSTLVLLLVLTLSFVSCNKDFKICEEGKDCEETSNNNPSAPSNLAPSEDGVSLSQHRIFLSSTQHNGSMGGTIGASTICQNLATQAGLTRAYKALIAESGSFPINSFDDKGEVYAFKDAQTKELVASSIGSLIANEVSNLPIYDDTFFEHPTNTLVWTGIDTSSNVAPHTCKDWTQGAFMPDFEMGRSGVIAPNDCYNLMGMNVFPQQNSAVECLANDPANEWKNNVVGSNGSQTCNQLSRIYCISQ
jgi:hypothetical protein